MVARVLLALAAAGLSLAGPALGATPGTLGTGAQPSLVIDASGTGHVAWVADDNGTNAVHYCRLARADPPSCGAPQTLLTPDNAAADVQILAAGDTVWILMPRPEEGDVQLWTSIGGGAFAGPTQVATGAVGSGRADAVLGPSGTAFVATASPGTYVQQVSLTGGAKPATSASLAGGLTQDPTIGVYGASLTPVLAAHGGSPDQAAFWRGSGGDPNDASGWAGPSVVGAGDDTRLAGGPAGLFLMTASPGAGAVQVRHFDEATGAFAAPVGVGPADTASEGDLAEALGPGPAAGALFAVWKRDGSPNRLRVAASGDGGRRWIGPADLLRDSAIFGLRAAVAPDGRGFVVWDQNSETGQVRAAQLTPPDATPPKVGLSKVKEVAGRSATWQIACPPTEAVCQGTVTLTASTVAASAAATRKLTLGRKAYRIAGGKKKAVRVNLSKKARALLKKRKRLKTTCTFKTTDSAGNVGTATRVITLHAVAFRHS